jgi:molecular chaperone GrpE
MENDKTTPSIDADDVEIVVDGELHDTTDIVKKIREKLKKCEIEKEEYLNGWQRSRADFVNSKKDEAKTREEFMRFAKEAILSDFIPLADHFERAFSHKEAWEKVDNNWRIGVESIYTELMQTLAQNGLKRLGNLGEKFDPMKHEPIGMEETEDGARDDTVSVVIDSGYELSGKVIRPAKVKIAKLK